MVHSRRTEDETAAACAACVTRVIRTCGGTKMLTRLIAVRSPIQATPGRAREKKCRPKGGGGGGGCPLGGNAATVRGAGA